ncbi:TonB-dependent receptor [Hymenobacter sp. 15J16-1T3B]|uniref:TonB-dependent receptor n=1 Tax=Hymenobacter sp. 15J16-1T3B TaxID=2886941 RepID=UPI001D129358|nr:TonB-dependent receptor [Hymenobacter sp. 15J16-1T3B]MCC3156389.1 TonB-dependent receptor [Hymenobacter sp. 15J16-1T3B]
MNIRRLLAIAPIVSVTALPAWAQQAATIRGTVTTQDGAPAEAVSVGLRGRPQGAITNAKGQFVIERVRDGDYTVVVSAVGLQTTAKAVTVSGGQGVTVDFVLAESAQQLREVTVRGARINRFARPSSEYVGKMPLQNIENPQVYHSIGKEILTEQLVFSVDDATRNAPGIQRMWEATGRSGDGGSYYNTRGFIVQSQLRNGLAGNVTGSIDAVNLEKLEVIKGPSATLYGSALTSYGGLMNRVTKTPYDHTGGEIAVAAGSYGLHRVSADVNLVDGNTPADQPRTLAFRLNTAYQYEDNFQGQGFNKSIAVAPSLSYRPTERLTINLDAEFLKGRGTGKQMFFSLSGTGLGVRRADELPLDYRESYTGTGLAADSRSTNLFGQVNYQLAPGFTSSTNFSSSHSFSDGFGAYFYLNRDRNGAFLVTRADQSTDNSTQGVAEVQQLFNGDFRLGTLRNRVVLGLDYLHVDSDQHFFYTTFDQVPLGAPRSTYAAFNAAALQAKYDASGPDGVYPAVSKRRTSSAFASDVLNLSERLSVLAAVRVDRFSNQGVTGTQDDDYSQTAVSPKFGVVFQPVKDRVSVFANYQNSFSNRGAYNAYDVAAADSVVQRLARLEQANQVEVGLKADAFDGKLTATVSYYDIRVKDLLRTDPNPLAAAKYLQVQDGTQRSRGVELDVVANPCAGLNVVAGFSYNDAKLTRASEAENGRRPATAGSPYLANLWLSYRLPETLVRGLGLGFGGNYASDNRIQNLKTDVFILPSYTVLNASVFYDQPTFRISAKVDNLTNERYWTGYTTMNAQKLRSLVGSVAYKF